MERWLTRMRWATRVGALCALAGLIVEFGFGLEPRLLRLTRAVEYGVVLLFAAASLTHFLLSRERLRLVRENWLDAILLAGIAAGFGGIAIGDSGDALERGSILALQGLIVLRMLIGFARTQERFAGPRLRPALLLLLTFLALILAGAAGLMMPRCRAPGAAPLSFLDALFTSTSAVCVTGLSVRDIGSVLSLRGQAVLLCLIQIGGLGLVTIGTALTVIERSRPKLSLMSMAGNLLGQPSQAGLRRFLGYTLGLTLLFELLGAAVLYGALPADLPGVEQRLWWGLFHSVSAFCNAGFGLSSQSLIPWAASPLILMTLASLIVLGGLGFPVLMDLLRFQWSSLRLVLLARARMRSLPRARWMRRKWGFLPWFQWPASALGLPRPSHLELNTKIVLAINALLIAGGALLFFLSERSSALLGLDAAQSAVHSLFQSITARTAGFNSLDLELLALPSLLLLLGLMAVGASSVSTGGGVKTGTVAVVLLTIRAMLRDRDDVEAFGRSIPRRIVNTSIAVAALYAMAVALVTTILAATQEGIQFIDLLFESVSALSTVGLSHGVTPRLDATGRIVIAVAMLLGRLGPLAVVWTFLARREPLNYRYPEEEVVIS
ncbi:MAG: hypothetical protein IPK67_16680 [Planctomycetes bacterium]|nr:hypothetical protein [Planctomycetota bacterium]